MKLIITMLCFLCSTQLFGQTVNTQLDTALAKKLGADEYGMKKYVFVILKTGSNKTTDKKFIDSCFVGHLANITRLAKQNQLIIAGPFGKNEADFRGLFILNVPNVTEANLLLETDPAIKSNLLKAELYPWYGSAAISEYLDFHDKIWKKKP
ncbi:MAG: hypothetical protein CFE21_10120 [Bacteroidetes bacterium B1(2017)]|nr:MAG: hypothetical protein CFE21_10120 [Bacteroidetes bacterium B1(2017)]